MAIENRGFLACELWRALTRVTSCDGHAYRQKGKLDIHGFKPFVNLTHVTSSHNVRVAIRHHLRTTDNSFSNYCYLRRLVAI